MTDSLVDRLHEHSRRLGYAEQTHDADVLSMCKEAKPHIDEAANVITALEGALKPFAAFADLSGADYLSENHVISLGSGMAARQLTIADCRKARAALSLLRGDRK